MANAKKVVLKWTIMERFLAWIHEVAMMITKNPLNTVSRNISTQLDFRWFERFYKLHPDADLLDMRSSAFTKSTEYTYDE